MGRWGVTMLSRTMSRQRPESIPDLFFGLRCDESVIWIRQTRKIVNRVSLAGLQFVGNDMFSCSQLTQLPCQTASSVEKLFNKVKPTNGTP